VTSSARLRLGVRDGYARWARTYTSEPNPMFALEERLLQPLLPKLAGRDLVDLGCGTGRWLQRLHGQGAASVTGVDGSPEMLAEAARRQLDGVRLLRHDCLESGLPANSADLVLNSFVLSHIADLAGFASELKRITRPGGQIFITDLHPGTARELNWKRAFRAGEDHVEIESLFRPLREVLKIFQASGLKVRAVLEPAMAEQERWIFEHHHREDLFEAASSHPAIVLLQLERSHEEAARPAGTHALWLTGARIALDAQQSVAADLCTEDSAIASIASRSLLDATAAEIDLSGYLLLPGLINAHDHLDFALFPRLGRGDYENAVEWANDIYHPESSPIREQLQVPKDTRLWWGALRNLLCGVTTVCHHNPPSECLQDQDFPVHVVPKCVWVHSMTFDPDLEKKLENRAEDELLIVHVAEGVDDRSRAELQWLDSLGALRAGTVIIHGLALRSQDFDLLRRRGVGMVWCPSSNLFLFGKTIDPRAWPGMGFAALGSDSPLTGRGDLLDEIAIAHALGTQASDVYALVTENPAAMLRLARGEGALRPGAAADLIAVRDDGRPPAERLCSLTYKDIEMVIVGGKVSLASPTIFARLSPQLCNGLEALWIGETERWLRAPVGELTRDAASALGRWPTLSGRPLRDPSALQ